MNFLYDIEEGSENKVREKLKKYIGPKLFYKHVFSMAIPLGFQQLISSCMGIVDSLMVSWIGQVTAVGTAVQIETLCTSVSWGSAAGVGIFSVQFFGAKDFKNLKKSFGLSVILAIISGLFWFLIATFFGESILRFYINDLEVIKNGLLYLDIVKFSYFPLALSFVFNMTYRNINRPKIPLVVGIMAMFINIIVNYILIFGLYGFPKMGIQGAAMGTFIAQIVSLLVHILFAYYTHQPFIGTQQEMFTFDMHFVKPILQKTQSIIFNELLFGFGSTLFIKAFGALGTRSMDAYYVGAKISDLFYAFANGFSNAVAAIIGVSLGMSDGKKAKEEGDYLMGLATMMSMVCLVFIYCTSSILVSVFDLTNQQVINEATLIVKVFALRIALRFFIVIVFSSLRAGGDSKVLTLLDSGLMWSVGIPLAFISVHIFQIQSIAIVFLICQLEQVVRVYFGIKRYQTGKWIVNLITYVHENES